ncbi:MAG: hypothetical protein ACRDOK_24675 [Streptosporangiaceae bacterium]
MAGRFCLAAAPAGPNTWLLSTVDLSFGPPREVTVELPPSG